MTKISTTLHAGGKFKKEEMNIQEHHMVSDLITVVVRAKIGAGNDSR